MAGCGGAEGAKRVAEKKQPDAKLRAMFWTTEMENEERRRAYDRKVENLVLEIRRENGLPGGPRRIYLTDKLNLTTAMMKLIEGFRVALLCEMEGAASPPLPSGVLPLLVERVPENRVPVVLAALRAAAKRLHDEDDTPPMHVARFFAHLRPRDGKK